MVYNFLISILQDKNCLDKETTINEIEYKTVIVGGDR